MPTIKESTPHAAHGAARWTGSFPNFLLSQDCSSAAGPGEVSGFIAAAGAARTQHPPGRGQSAGGRHAGPSRARSGGRRGGGAVAGGRRVPQAESRRSGERGGGGRILTFTRTVDASPGRRAQHGSPGAPGSLGSVGSAGSVGSVSL